MRYRKKVCRLCAEKIEYVDYKDIDLLKDFLSERGKIIGRRVTGTCAKHQRQLTKAIKRARMIALLPFTKK
ncbi:30S ribosomal protein S18 [Candidatus Poribacteria bacterium]|nr:MAG: 30S ribosomal protein S18 [Candidatus Poribacteria bacterium]